MNIIEMRAVFQREPPREERLEVEGRLGDIVKILAPESTPEISSGEGTFWIAVEVLLGGVAGWAAIQTANWAFKKFILDGPVSRALANKSQDDDNTEQQPITEPENDQYPGDELMPAISGPLDSPNETALHRIVDLVTFAEPVGLCKFTLKQLRTDVDSGTGVVGRICRLSLSDDGKWSAEFIQVDTRDDFFAL